MSNYNDNVPKCEVHGNNMSPRHLKIYYGADHSLIEVDRHCPNCEGELTQSELENRLLKIGNGMLEQFFPKLKPSPKATKVEVL